jgi:hypothetical protein
MDFVEQRLDTKSEFYNSVGRNTLRVNLSEALNAPRFAVTRGASASPAQ